MGVDTTLGSVELEVDETGRVLLPEELRQALHLVSGAKLRAEMKGQALTLTPQERRPSVLIGEDGWPTIRTLQPLELWEDPVEEARAERLRELMGDG